MPASMCELHADLDSQKNKFPKICQKHFNLSVIEVQLPLAVQQSEHLLLIVNDDHSAAQQNCHRNSKTRVFAVGSSCQSVKHLDQ